MKLKLAILISFYSIKIYCQEHNSLKQMLFESVAPCYSMLADNDNDGNSDMSKITDDSKNGYLKVSGAWPTCGCGCEAIAGAYSNADGSYSILETEEWNCTWQKKLSSNKNLKDILPEDFGIKTFIPNYIQGDTTNSNAIFYLDLQIPRIGTDTKVSLELIPLGIDIHSAEILKYEYSDSRQYAKCVSLYNLASMAKDLKDEKSIDLLLNNKYNLINAKDKSLIDGLIREDDDSRFKSMSSLIDRLHSLKNIYNLRKSMAYSSLILGWDISKGRFYIKEKIKSTFTTSFKEFLIKSEYWSPSC